MASSKLCVVTTCNLKFAPYVKLYTDILDRIGCEYDLVIWDKYDLHEDVTYAYHGKKNDGEKIKTFFQYIGFGRFLDSILVSNNYERLIICNPAPLLFVKRKTLEKYCHRFIWDIRDDTPIRKLFKRRFDEIRNMASSVVTSSRRYDAWIGGETILSHNAEKEMIKKYYEYQPVSRQNSVIQLINAGKMIEEKENIEILKVLGNSPTYKFIYYGREVPGKLQLMDYCKENGIENVEFFGTYNKDEIVDIYRSKGDLINILRADTFINRNALPNKLYEAVISGVPLIVYEHNTVISEYAHKYYLGIVLKDGSELIQIQARMKLFDWEKYAQGRLAFLELVLQDIVAFEKLVVDFAQSKKVL